MDSGCVQLHAGQGARLSITVYKELCLQALEPLTQRDVNILFSVLSSCFTSDGVFACLRSLRTDGCHLVYLCPISLSRQFWGAPGHSEKLTNG